MYTTVKETRGAIDAAVRLAAARRSDGDAAWSASAIAQRLPLLVDQVMAEAGVVEPHAAAQALVQSAGDVSRAVSLVRAWAACLPRLGRSRVAMSDLALERRITPAIREPDGGQYLGATVDYAQRLLDLGAADPDPHAPAGETGVAAQPTEPAPRPMPATLARACDRLEEEHLIADPALRAHPDDRTRQPLGARSGRGPFLQALARAETGALTAVAYTAVRGTGDDAPDPTVVELRSGTAPVRVAHGMTGKLVEVGRVPLTCVELALYRAHGNDETEAVDGRLTLGVGATVGRLERRAIGVALLDGRVARAAEDPAGTAHQLPDDEEWLLVALDGQEATGFVEHLKLPHHVTFTSDLDRVRAVRAGNAAVKTERTGD